MASPGWTRAKVPRGARAVSFALPQLVADAGGRRQGTRRANATSESATHTALNATNGPAIAQSSARVAPIRANTSRSDMRKIDQCVTLMIMYIANCAIMKSSIANAIWIGRELNVEYRNVAL